MLCTVPQKSLGHDFYIGWVLQLSDKSSLYSKEKKPFKVYRLDSIDNVKGKNSNLYTVLQKITE